MELGTPKARMLVAYCRGAATPAALRCFPGIKWMLCELENLFLIKIMN